MNERARDFCAGSLNVHASTLRSVEISLGYLADAYHGAPDDFRAIQAARQAVRDAAKALYAIADRDTE